MMHRGLLRVSRFRAASRPLLASASSSQHQQQWARHSSGQANNEDNKKWFLGAGAGVLAIGVGFWALKSNQKSAAKTEQKEEAKAKPAVEEEVKKESAEDPPKPAEGPLVTSMHKDATPNLPKHVDYLLVGAGTASFTASRAIRAKDPTAKVLMVGAEERLPYMRPPLSKEMWFTDVTAKGKQDVKFRQWNGKQRSIFYEPEVRGERKGDGVSG